MAKTFDLEVMAPDKKLFSGKADSVTVTGTDDIFTVLADHMPMISGLGIGAMTLKHDGNTDVAYHSGGFIEIKNNSVIIFTEACEWAGDIDTMRAETARQKALEKLSHKQSNMEHKHLEISMLRAITRLDIAKSRNINNK